MQVIQHMRSNFSPSGGGYGNQEIRPSLICTSISSLLWCVNSIFTGRRLLVLLLLKVMDPVSFPSSGWFPLSWPPRLDLDYSRWRECKIDKWLWDFGDIGFVVHHSYGTLVSLIGQVHHIMDHLTLECMAIRHALYVASCRYLDSFFIIFGCAKCVRLITSSDNDIQVGQLLLECWHLIKSLPFVSPSSLVLR